MDVRILRRIPECQFFGGPVPLRQRRARLHRRRLQALLHDALADDDIRRVKGGVYRFLVAIGDPGEGHIVGRVIMQLRRVSTSGLFRIDDGRQLFVIHTNPLGGVLRLGAVFGEHDGHAVADITHPIHREGRVFWRDQVRIRDQPSTGYCATAAVFPGIDSDDAGRRFRRAGVDAADPRMGERAAHDRHMQGPRQLDVIGIARIPGDQTRVFAPADARAEDSCRGRGSHQSPPLAAA